MKSSMWTWVVACWIAWAGSVSAQDTTPLTPGVRARARLDHPGARDTFELRGLRVDRQYLINLVATGSLTLEIVRDGGRRSHRDAQAGFVRYTPDHEDVHHLVVSAPDGWTGTYELEYDEVGVVDLPDDHGDDAAHATPWSGDPIDGRLATPRDVDVFRTLLQGDRRYRIRLLGGSHDHLTVRGPNASFVSADPAHAECEVVPFVDEPYVVEVRTLGLGPQPYRLEVEDLGPHATSALPADSVFWSDPNASTPPDDHGDDEAHATLVALGETAVTLATATDVDVLRFVPAPGHHYEVRHEGAGVALGVHPDWSEALATSLDQGTFEVHPTVDHFDLFVRLVNRSSDPRTARVWIRDLGAPAAPPAPEPPTTPAPPATPEPNDEVHEQSWAGSITAPGGTFELPMTFRAGLRYRLWVTDLTDGMDSILSVLGSDGSVLYENDDDSSLGLGSLLRFQVVRDFHGTVRVRHWSRRSGRGGFRLYLRTEGTPTAAPAPAPAPAPRPAPAPTVDVPSEAGFVDAPALEYARGGHTATRLIDGRVLVVGGWGEDGTPLDVAELFDPLAGTWTHVAGPARAAHTATVLADGRVLIAGGEGPDRLGRIGTRAEVFVFDPLSDVFTEALGTLRDARSDHHALLLPSGQVLLAGGLQRGRWLETAERFDPVQERSLAVPSATHAWAEGGSATRLGGRVVIHGGGSDDPATLAWDPQLDTVDRRAATQSPRWHTATALGGRVVVTGGYADDPTQVVGLEADGREVALGALTEGRARHTATALDAERLLIVGGAELAPRGGRLVATNEVASAELLQVTARGLTRDLFALRTPRLGHTATRLDDGSVLVVGGWAGALRPNGRDGTPLAACERFLQP